MDSGKRENDSVPVRILLLEDLAADAELCRREVEKVLPGCVWHHCDNRVDYIAALGAFKPDIIISDYVLPGFDGMTAMRLAQEALPDTPFIILTGSMNEETAVECMKAGAWDYVIKERMKRLGPAVTAALEQGKMRRERAAALKALMDSEARYRAVVEALEDPVCRWLPDTTLTFANRTYLDLFGLGPGEVGRRRWLDFVPPGEREEVAARYRDLVENPRRFTYEHRVFITGGEERIFYWTDTPLFDPEGRLTEFQSVGRDVTERTRHRAELMRLNERLQRALEGTILAITAAVEVRDPYTAGHQRRTAKLAVDIAREMDLPETVVHGLSLAAEIHDLGKIAVPSEILAKPTRLTETEFALIKTHCESGYRILKDVPFDYPVAEIVYEHHERLDGSGYPRGLRGDETLLESRILAVADVVEAMSSFRPYRPPLGIEAALDEIERKKGILYDGAAVEACLRLFREKGYRLDG